MHWILLFYGIIHETESIVKDSLKWDQVLKKKWAIIMHDNEQFSLEMWKYFRLILYNAKD